MGHRPQRVADEIRKELGSMLVGEIRDPRVQLASVSRVEVSRDLSHARIFFSVLSTDEEERNATMEGLDSAKGFIRRRIGSTLGLRQVPELHFELDRGAEHAQHISDLLEDLP